MATTTATDTMAGRCCKACGQPVQVGQRVTYRYSTTNGLTHEWCPAKVVALVAPVASPVSERAALVARYGEETVARNLGPADAHDGSELLGGCREPEIDR